MNSQNDSAKQTGGNVSELEMVGALLFGSISDENVEGQPGAQMKSENRSRKVNLGSHIAPESSRQWDASEQETVLNSSSASTISSPNETSAWTGSVSETQSAVKPAASARKTSWVTRIYGVSMIFMTLCVVVLGWQLFVEKKGEPKEAVPASLTSPSEMVQMEAPMVPTIEESMMENGENSFASMQVEDASKLAYSDFQPAPSDSVAGLPNTYETVGEGLNEAPVYQAYGDSVTISEEYPTFNAELAGMAPTSVPAPAPAVAPVPTYAPAPAPAQAVSPAPTYAPVPAPAPAVNPALASQYAGTTTWNAGESMDEVPVFNSEISNFNAAPTAPQMAPTAPQVGNQAPLPTSLPQYNAPEQSPRKLTPPAAGHTDPNAAVQPSAPVYSEAPAEEVPTFNPNLGVDGALPVSYY